MEELYTGGTKTALQIQICTQRNRKTQSGACKDAMGCIPQNPLVEALITGTSECDCVWR